MLIHVQYVLGGEVETLGLVRVELGFGSGLKNPCELAERDPSFSEAGFSVRVV